MVVDVSKYGLKKIKYNGLVAYRIFEEGNKMPIGVIRRARGKSDQWTLGEISYWTSYTADRLEELSQLVRDVDCGFIQEYKEK